MSVETAAANDAVLRVLTPQPGDRVLEVGFGHGRTIERVAAMVGDGLVTGIDTSDEMVRMATRRCRRLIAAGRLRLSVADGASIPYPDRSFDRAYAVHTIYFWDDLARYVRELARVLRDRGRLVLGFHDKESSATASFPASVYTFRTVEEVRLALQEGGFDDVEAPAHADGLAIVVGRRELRLPRGRCETPTQLVGERVKSGQRQ